MLCWCRSECPSVAAGSGCFLTAKPLQYVTQKTSKSDLIACSLQLRIGLWLATRQLSRKGGITGFYSLDEVEFPDQFFGANNLAY